MTEKLETIWKDRFVKRTYEKAGYLAERYNIRNYRLHPDQQQAIVEGSLDKLGWIGEVKIARAETGPNTGKPDVLFDGHLRVKIVLVRQGPEALIPVNYYDLTEYEANQALLLHDTTTGMAQIDFSVLGDLIKNTPPLEIPEFDEWLSKTLEEEASRLLGASGAGEGPKPESPPLTDKAEELQQKWQVRPGDLWAIGDHRLICGDCREPETWELLLKGQRANGVFTSPPYAEQRKKQYGGVPVREYVEWWEAVQSNVRENLAEDGSFFVNIKPHCEDGQRVLYVFDLALAMAREWDWRFVDELCWAHVGYPGDFGERFKNQFEPIYHFASKKFVKIRHGNVVVPPSEATLSRIATARRSGEVSHGRKYSQTGTGFNIDFSTMQQAESGVRPGNIVWADQDKGHSGVNHTALFPVTLPTFFIKAYSDPGDLWLDPFCGSGTTILAAYNEGRIGMGIEILPKYCSVILERCQAQMGTKPELVMRNEN